MNRDILVKVWFYVFVILFVFSVGFSIKTIRDSIQLDKNIDELNIRIIEANKDIECYNKYGKPKNIIIINCPNGESGFIIYPYDTSIINRVNEEFSNCDVELITERIYEMEG